MIEINHVIYDCGMPLALLLSRLNHTKQRIRAHYWMLRPYEGYVQRSEFPHVYEEKPVHKPLLVWHRTSYRGRRIDEAIVEKIEFSNRSEGGLLWDSSGLHIDLGDPKLFPLPMGGFTVDWPDDLLR
jgi:hypothetical protein